MRACLTVVAFTASLVFVQLAQANGPPATDIRTSEGTQKGGLAFVEWTDRNKDVCVTGSGDGPGTFPNKGLEVSESGARVVFATPLKPKRVKVSAWRAVDAEGRPIGDPEKLAVELSPRLAPDGHVRRWRASFAATPPPDYYLRMYARWQGVCGGPRHMLRTYHLTGPTAP